MSNAIELQVDKNPFAIASRQQQGGMVAVASSRQAQEVQAMCAIAKRFPRNQEAAYANIMVACQRKGLAEGALYSYPRGGQQITGPSIRLAEAIAQSWGNLDFGVIELEQRQGESTVMAYCVDLETNTRQTKVFQVAHERHTKTGVTKLTDPRDVYETAANQGARRLRACILGVIPGDIIDAAIEQCEKTLKGGKEPLIDRVRNMAVKFQEDFQVTPEMIEKRLLHNLDAVNEQEFVSLRKIYVSLRDGASRREDWFETVGAVQGPEGLGSDAVQAPPASTVPNQVLGEEKPKKQPKSKAAEKPAAEQAPVPQTINQTGTPVPSANVAPLPTGRMALAQAIRDKVANAGMNEAELMERAYEAQMAPPGTLLTQLPEATMKEIMEHWNELIAN